jgi:uncharacterized damage-inducible protein DinB
MILGSRNGVEMSGVPYAEALGGRDADAVIATTSARLEKVFESKSAEELEQRPAPGKWCLREVMAHLADCEIAWGWRLRQVLAEEHAVLQPFDQDAWARMYGAYSFSAAWATYKAMRAWNVAFVKDLNEAEKEKMYTHPERGEERLWTMVEIMAGHDLHHLKTLELITEKP